MFYGESFLFHGSHPFQSQHIFPNSLSPKQLGPSNPHPGLSRCKARTTYLVSKKPWAVANRVAHRRHPKEEIVVSLPWGPPSH